MDGGFCCLSPFRPAATVSVYLFQSLFSEALLRLRLQGFFAQRNLPTVFFFFFKDVPRAIMSTRKFRFVLLICNCGTNTVAITGFSCTKKLASRKQVSEPQAFLAAPQKWRDARRPLQARRLSHVRVEHGRAQVPRTEGTK